MKNSIRCCISCILPCGSLDVIRIVHANGRVEEINRMVRAADIIKAYPNHVLKYVDPVSSDPKIIVIMQPEAELQRGKIYFLMPAPPQPPKRRTRIRQNQQYYRTRIISSVIGNTSDHNSVDKDKQLSMKSDRYLTEILSTNKVIISTGNEYRRRGPTGIWRPHLESILETPILE